MARKRRKFISTAERIKRLQQGTVAPDQPDVSFGTGVGSYLGSQKRAGMQVHFEKSECSCCGANERCSRCNGTGYYAKQVVDLMTEMVSSAPIRGKSVAKQESTFSNDARGGIYGIRESGRFSSNPLHDDHDE
jgi:hypothetical protein